MLAILGLLETPEDGGTTTLRNFTNHSLTYTASQAKRLEPLTAHL